MNLSGAVEVRYQWLKGFEGLGLAILVLGGCRSRVAPIATSVPSCLKAWVLGCLVRNYGKHEQAARRAGSSSTSYFFILPPFWGKTRTSIARHLTDSSKGLTHSDSVGPKPTKFTDRAPQVRALWAFGELELRAGSKQNAPYH